MSALLTAGLALTNVTAVVTDTSAAKHSPSRYDTYELSLTNNGDETDEVGVCPADVTLVAAHPNGRRHSAFAITLGEGAWSHRCETRTLAPGETMRLAVHIRQPVRPLGGTRWLDVPTSAGLFRIVPPGRAG